MITELWRQVNSHKTPPQPFCGNAGRAPAVEGIEDNVTREPDLPDLGKGVHGDESVGQSLRERRRMALLSTDVLWIHPPDLLRQFEPILLTDLGRLFYLRWNLSRLAGFYEDSDKF